MPTSTYVLHDAKADHWKLESHEDWPRLVLLCAWTDASPKNIKKYVDGYQALYPLSPVLVAHTSSIDFFSGTDGLTQRTAPAVEMIRHILDAKNDNYEGAGLLAHAISNGGSSHLACIARKYHSDTQQPLPADSLVLDSTPTRPTFSPLLKSVSMALPRHSLIRLPLQMAISVGLFVVFILPRWFGMRNVGDRTFVDLNSLGPAEEGDNGSQEWIRNKAMRTYIYSYKDELCPAEEITFHFEKAQDRGFRVRREVWEESGHAAHMKDDPQRYWNIIAGSWEDRH